MNRTNPIFAPQQMLREVKDYLTITLGMLMYAIG